MNTREELGMETREAFIQTLCGVSYPTEWADLSQRERDAWIAAGTSAHATGKDEVLDWLRSINWMRGIWENGPTHLAKLFTEGFRR